VTGVLRLPWDLAATIEPGWVQGVLGIGVYGFLVGWRASIESKIFMSIALLAFLLLLGLGQVSPRFFLEPYLWVGAGVVAVPWNRRKLVWLGCFRFRVRSRQPCRRTWQPPSSRVR